MVLTWIAFLGAAAATIGCGWWMLRTMSMLKAGLLLMGSSLGAAILLFMLHADIVAAMTVMMFGPAMLGMVLFMLMLMEDSGGFMMTASPELPMPRDAPDAEPEVLRAAAPLLGDISEIAAPAAEMDMAMTNAQTRWGAWIAGGFFVANAAVVGWTPWGGTSELPSVEQARLIGEALLDKYMVVFEGCGLLILLTVVAATMLGRREAP
jgi:NADH:ubiquinone oxidoreductase subunit 6 (subunit J)